MSSKVNDGKTLPFWKIVVYEIVRNSSLLYGRLVHRLEKIVLDGAQFDGPALFVANHASNLDPPFIGSLIPKRMNYLVKEELLRIPFIGWVIRSCSGIPLNRSGNDRAALRTVVERLKAGERVLLFPEGTRSEDGRLQPAKRGSGMIAFQGGAPITPVYIEGSFEALPRGAKWMRPVKVKVIFGETFDLPPRDEGMSTRDYYQLCADTMMERIARTRDRAPGVEDGARRAA